MDTWGNEVTIPCKHCAGSGEMRDEEMVLGSCTYCDGSGRIAMEETGMQSSLDAWLEKPDARHRWDDRSDEIQLSAELVVRLILKPRILATYAVSALLGSITSIITSFYILSSERFWYDLWPSVGLMFIGLGAAICIYSSFSFMKSALKRNSSDDVKLAFRGVIIGVIPGCIAAAIVTLLLRGVMAS